jgi:hypothetical protein
MTLSKYTDNLYQSEVYRELERQAVKNGFFKPTDAELVKLAAQEIQQTQSINREVDATPSNDLIVDVARLAYAMRRKGLITQAEDIEQKLVMFKQAENAFYNVTKETNEDLMNFAHRDGDVNLIEGSGDLGTFETLQSVADKILAVTRKEPTGKLAALASMINKVAQQGASGDWGEPQGGQAASGAAPQPKTRREILEAVQGTLNQFDTARKQIQNLPGINTFGFDNVNSPGQLSAYVYFASLAGRQVNPNDIDVWFKTKEVSEKEGVFVSGLVNSSAMYNKLSSHNADFLIAIANVLGIGDALQKTYLNENSPKYIYSAVYFSTGLSQYASEACQWLQQTFQNLTNRTFGANNEIFNDAQNKMVGIVEKLVSDLNAININVQATTTNSAFKQLIHVGNGINDALARFTNGTSFRYLSLVNPTLINQIVALTKSISKNISEQYKEISGSEGVRLVDIDTTALGAAFNYWDSKSGEDENAAAIADRIQMFKEIIDNHKNKPWVELQEALLTSPLKINHPNEASLQHDIDAIVKQRRM